MRLSEREYEQLTEAAGAARLSVAAYLAMVAAHGGERPAGTGWTVAQRRAVAAQLYWVRNGLRGAWTNLNRLTRIAQGQGRVPPEVSATASAIAEYLPRLEDLMVALDPQIEGAVRERQPGGGQ